MEQTAFHLDISEDICDGISGSQLIVNVKKSEGADVSVPLSDQIPHQSQQMSVGIGSLVGQKGVYGWDIFSSDLPMNNIQLGEDTWLFRDVFERAIAYPVIRVEQRLNMWE